MLSNTQPNTLIVKIYFELLYGDVEIIQFDNSPTKGGQVIQTNNYSSAKNHSSRGTSVIAFDFDNKKLENKESYYLQVKALRTTSYVIKY